MQMPDGKMREISSSVFEDSLKKLNERAVDARPVFREGEELDLRGGRFEVALIVEGGIFLRGLPAADEELDEMLPRMPKPQVPGSRTKRGGGVPR